MTTVIPDGGGFKIYSKGAPDVILERCTGIVRRDGSVGKFLPEDKVGIDQVIKNMQEKSQLKVMCIAYRHVYPSGTSLFASFILHGSNLFQALSSVMALKHSMLFKIFI